MIPDIDSLFSGQQAGNEGISTLLSVQQVGSDTPILQSSQASPPQDNPKRLFYTAEEIDAMCEKMEGAKEFVRLGEFLDTLSPAELARDSEKLAKARCVVAFHRQKYAELHSLIQMRNFSPHNHRKLQTLWFEGHYAEEQLTRPKKLSNPDKFRIREKHPLPSTIFDGDKMKYGVKESTRNILEAFFEKKRLPSKEEKEALAIETREELKFIKEWFKNRRNRKKRRTRMLVKPASINRTWRPNRLQLSPAARRCLLLPPTGQTHHRPTTVARLPLLQLIIRSKCVFSDFLALLEYW